MRSKTMGAIPLGDPRLTLHHHRSHLQPSKDGNHGPVSEEIEGLIRVYIDGHVERFPIVREVPPAWAPLPEAGVMAADLVIDESSSASSCLWARIYAPLQGATKLPLLVYFHGGGFCVASAAWSCYHEFLARFASRAGCVVASVNYRLAPEHRLPAAYEDGLKAVKWLRGALLQQQARDPASTWWAGRCDSSRVFLGGDSAGATIAHNVAAQLGGSRGAPSGVILIHPFFGGESRTASEKSLTQPPSSALSLAASDAYWRLALPAGASRDHPWCNPLGRCSAPYYYKLEKLKLPPYLVFVAETDILRDRDVEFCRAMRKAGKSVEQVVHGGVGHAFHVLSSSRLAQSRTQEMMAQIKAFMADRRG